MITKINISIILIMKLRKYRIIGRIIYIKIKD